MSPKSMCWCKDTTRKGVRTFIGGCLCIFLVWTISMAMKRPVMNNWIMQKPKISHDGVTKNIQEFKTKNIPFRNIYFMKIHKTGTTTLFDIFSRYAMKHNLSVTIFYKSPQSGNSEVLLKFLNPPFTEGKSAKYNMLLDHAQYFPGTIKKILKEPTTYVTLLRNPLLLTDSILHKKHYIGRKLKLDKTDLIASYIEKLETKSVHKDYPLNYMSNIFRIASEDRGKDKTFRKLEKTFLVMITDHYDESMILMRRRLGWSFQDVLYSKLNVQGYKHKPVNETLYRRFCKWSWADCKLYEYFNRTFWSNFHNYGDSVIEEVSHYKKIRHEIGEFCSPVVQHIKEKSPLEAIKVLKIAGSKWHEPFTYNFRDCALNIVDPRTFRAYFFYKQNPEQICKAIEGKDCRIVYDDYGICDKVCQISKQHSDVFGEILNITKFNYQSLFFKLD